MQNIKHKQGSEKSIATQTRHQRCEPNQAFVLSLFTIIRN